MERAVAIDVCRKYFISGQVPGGGKSPIGTGSPGGHLGVRSAGKYLRDIARAIELVRKPYAEARNGEVELRKDVERERGVTDFLSLLLWPSIERSHQNEAAAEARCRMAAAFCRIKAAGRIPESLEAADPCTGKPLLYRRLEKGFELRSPGPNQADDGGAEDDLVLKSPK
jgi:hypothetical protein